ncbi:MAG: sulfate ABC transporter permease subunit CysW [Fimbriiglobus sp.]|nr:sulfate ABC transporter permease subunit CysW [Fimbriiglobus sp.]
MRLSPRGRVLPGFGLGLGISLLYLSLLVLLPLAACVLKAAELSGSEFAAAVWNPRAVAAYQLTFAASLQAALINVPLGLIVAWTLVRYEFPGKRLLDALVDVPFALPTAVAGLVYGSLYVKTGWLGQFLCPLGFEGAFSRTGIVLVLVFTGFPFVVRTVQPVLEDMDAELEQAASTLGASKWQTFRRVLLPMLVPPTLTGFTLAFARAIGEYGSVIFVSSNIRGQTEIAPVLIVSRLEEFAYKEAAAVAVLLLGVSFLLLGVVNLLERWTQPGSAPRFVRWPLAKVGHGLEAASAWLAGQGGVKWLRTLLTPVGGFVLRNLQQLMVGATSLVLGVLVAIPLANVFAQAFSKGPWKYIEFLVTDPDTRHAMFLTAIVAPLAVALNTVFGVAAAYTVARFRFPGRTLLTTLIDLPFSVSPVVAGLVLVLVFGGQSPVGSWLKEHGFQVIFAPPGLVLATAFVTFPFVARELLPVLEATGPDEELAARSLGANGWQMFCRVTLPNIKWGLLYGVILCNARAMGEFGAIYVVSGRISGQTDTMPLRVEKLFQEYNQPAAFAVASVLTLLALVTLGAKAALERKVHAERGAGTHSEGM